MTSGERMVWAAAFVEILHRGGSGVAAARHAAISVRSIRAARNGTSAILQSTAIKLPAELDTEAVEMLDDMLTPDEERVRSVSQAVIDEDE